MSVRHSPGSAHHLPPSPGDSNVHTANIVDRNVKREGTCVVHRNWGGPQQVFNREQMTYVMCALKELDLSPNETANCYQRWFKKEVNPSVLRDVVRFIERKYDGPTNNEKWRNTWSYVMDMYQNRDIINLVESNRGTPR